MVQEPDNQQPGTTSDNGMVLGAGLGIVFVPFLRDWAGFGIIIGAMIGLALGGTIPLHRSKP